MAKKSKAIAKKGGVTNKGSLYAYISPYGKEIIDFELTIMRDEKQHINVRVSCANKLMDKLLADLKASEVEVSGNVRVHIVEDKHNNNNE